MMSKIQIFDSDFYAKRPSQIILFIIKRVILDTKCFAPHSRRVDRVFHEQLRAYPSLGYWPNIHQPRTFNEKILNRMVLENGKLFTIATDKLKSRKYVADRVGDEILPALYFNSDNAESIPLESLPDSFVIKSNFGSGQFRIIDDAATVNEQALIKDCREWLSKDYYLHKAIIDGHYNFDYHQITPQIMIEKRLTGCHQDIPRDYKFYVFHGRVKYVHVDTNRFGKRSMRFFDRQWNPQEFQKGGNPLGPVIDEPEQYNQMIEVAESLGQEFDFIRVDLYITENNNVKFGELTPNPGAGKSPFKPKNVDNKFGELW